MKYIVEADEHVQMISLIAVREGTAIMITGNVETFQTADKELDDSYQKGLEEGKKQAKVQAHLDVCHDIERVAHGNYQQGLDDAWECARKIVTWPDRSLVNSDAFDLDPGENIFTKYSASRAIEKLKAYEEQQKADEIKVGDEVTPKSNDINWSGVVVGVDDTNAMVMTRDGYTAMYRLEIIKKTGCHFPQMAELLEAMKEGAE